VVKSELMPYRSRPTRQPSQRRASSTTDANDTSWQPVNKWYNKQVGKEGHYYHQHVVIPKSLSLLDLHPGDALLDLACGQGVLSRKISAEVGYHGIDLAQGLIKQAHRLSSLKQRRFSVGDITQPLKIPPTSFSHATIILALQNVAEPQGAITNAAQALKTGGKLLIVLNHPCFRIPRQSSWGIDEQHKTQYRRIDRYLSPLKIPIVAHPGQNRSAHTWSFHRPLSEYSAMLKTAGFMIETLEEWVSDKSSEGKAAKMENRSRAEFPLFLALLARKV
jgi:ubiquinone/menaquinone biosynthesis C-methylase UbiE